MPVESKKATLAVINTGLLTLPEEIRHIILKMLFEGSRETPYLSIGECAARRGDRKDLKAKNTSAILRTCTTLYFEGLTLYYQNIYYCLSTGFPRMHMRAIMDNGMRIHLRKFVGFPHSSSFGHWTQVLEHFPNLETIIFYGGYDICMPVRGHFPFETYSQPQGDYQDMSNTPAKIKEIFHKQNEPYDLEAVIKARPKLSITGIVNFVFRHTVLNAYHTISLVDFRDGNVIEILDSHRLCQVTDRYRVQTARLELRRPCNPWSCEWIASRDNILDLIAEEDHTRRSCENLIYRRSRELSSKVINLSEKMKTDPLFTPKREYALRHDPRVITVEDFLALYRRGEWDDWCPHGEIWHETCGCLQTIQDAWATLRARQRVFADVDED